MDLFQTIILLILIALVVRVFIQRVRNFERISGILLMIILIVFYIIPVEDHLIKLLYPGQKIVYNEHDPYGNIVVTKSEDQINIFSNNNLMYSHDEIIKGEEIAHFPLVQATKTDTILQISGGHTGSLKEILNYTPDHIDYVEANPGLIAVLRKYTDHLDHNKISIISKVDAIRFLKQTRKQYHAIIVAVPPPTNLALSRYYSLGFFKQLRARLHQDGILSISLPTAADYSSESAIRLNSSLYNTLKQVFKNVKIIPGTNNYFLASENPLSLDIPGLIKKKNMHTDYVNENYITSEEMRMRSDLLHKEIDENLSAITTDKPNAFFYSISYWAGKFNINIKIVIILSFILLIIFLLPHTGNLGNLNMFFAGFCSAGFEIILLFKLQTGLGNLYQYSALIISLFMIGLAIGSYPFKKFNPSSPYIIIIFTILLSFVGIVITIDLPQLNGYSTLLTLYISLLTIIVSFFTGAIFRFSSEWKSRKKTDSEQDLYSSDLSGGAFGSLFSALIFIPFAGITGAAYLLASILIISSLLLLFRSKVLRS